MGKKRGNPKITVEIVVRPEVGERQEAALAMLAGTAMAGTEARPEP